jgi:hypothetical protein
VPFSYSQHESMQFWALTGAASTSSNPVAQVARLIAPKAKAVADQFRHPAPYPTRFRADHCAIATLLFGTLTLCHFGLINTSASFGWVP